jgi:general secretion pathway protein C
MKRLPLLLSLLAVIALSASIAYWVLQLYQPQQRPLAAAPVAAVPEPAPDAAATLFGGQAAAVVATNYQLTGVVAAGRESVAILVADGQPPKALKIGRELASGVTVQEVHPRYVMLSEGGVLKRIDLATDAKPAADMASPMPMPERQQEPQQQDQPPPQQAAPMPVPPPQPAQVQQPPPSTVVQPPPAPATPVQMPPPTRSINTPGGQPPAE